MRFLLIILFFISSQTHAQLAWPSGDWVAIDSEPIGKDFVTVLKGLLLSFENDSVKISGVYSNKDTIVPCRFSRNKMFLDGKLFGRIRKNTKDSLVIITNHNRRITFRKIDPVLTAPTPVDFTAGPWDLFGVSEPEVKQRITFYDRGMNAGTDRTCVLQTKGTKFKRQSVERWALKQVSSNLLLAIQSDRTDAHIYQVTGATNQIVKLKNLTNPEFDPLVLRRSQPNRPIDFIEKMISGRTWKTDDVLRYASPEDEPFQILDTIFYSTSYDHITDSTLIPKEALISKSLSMIFGSDHGFKLYLDGKLFQQARWTISSDGEYIVLNEGQMPEDYIELIEISGDQMIIGKQDEFKLASDHRSMPYYYELRLK
jgi:hypothetical protein